MTRPIRMIALSLCLAAGVASAGDWAPPEVLGTLEGTWESPAAEPWYGGWGTREFVFRDRQWSLTFVHALDPGMTIRTFQFRTGGGYAVQEPGPVTGAFHTVFDEDWKHLTLLTSDPDLAAAMGLADCGLVPNLEADISATGCAGWRPVAICGEDHDLFGMNAEGGLHFGVRPADNDMCAAEKTPSALLPAVVRRGSRGG